MINSTLEHLYATHLGNVSDKWSAYLTEYDYIFSSKAEKPINLLEIGIQNGGSLEIWAKYFPNAKNIIGCDINPKCLNLRYTEPNIHLFVGDANSTEIQKVILEKSPQFDVIIDDGSHMSSDIVKSFALYFPYLENGGIYIAEDLHCSYWKPFEGGLLNPRSSIEFFKRLADIANFEHWTSSQNRVDILQSFMHWYDCSFQEEVLAQIHSIEFVNSMCVIRKRAKHENKLGHRVIVGSVADVNTDIMPLKNRPYQMDPNLLDVNQSEVSEGFASSAGDLLGRVWRRLRKVFA